jgi:hypothetical protein
MAGVVMLAFTGGITLLFVAYMLVSFDNTAATVPLINSNQEAMDVIDQGNQTIKDMDGLFAFFIFMVCMITIIAAFLMPSHPVLFIIFFFLTMILIPVSAMLSNAYEEIAATSPISTVAGDYPISQLIFDWLPNITVIVSGLIAVAMWAFGGRGGGGGIY